MRIFFFCLTAAVYFFGVSQTVLAAPAIKQFLPAEPPPKAVLAFSPATAPGKFIQLDISRYKSRDLVSFANRAREEGDYKKAIQYQFWAVQNGGDGQYDLACYYALAGNVKAAMYWLQADAEAGNSIDIAWLERDPDLEQVRAHANWPSLQNYLAAVADYWSASGNKAYQALVPQNHDRALPLPVLIALHGKGDTPLDFVGEIYQSLSDDLGIAIIAVSGVNPLGKNAFRWSTRAATNQLHIASFLQTIFREEKIIPGKMALYGFSQGAQVSLQMAVSEPKKWLGALAMSPGLSPVKALTLTQSRPNLKHQQFIITNGEKEHRYNLNLAQQNISDLKAMGADVAHIVYPDKGHQFPPDFYQKFSLWISEILQLDAAGT